MKPAYAAVVLVPMLALVPILLACVHSGSCVVGNGHTSDAEDDLPLAFGGASSDLWNVGFAGGTAEMCDQQSGLSTIVDLTSIVVSSSANQVIGYPHVGYGYGEFDTPFGGSIPGLSFPMAIGTFDETGIQSVVNYSLSMPRSQPMDFAFDLWIEGAPQPGHRALLTDLEVMVWLYNQTMRPAGTLRGTLTTNAVIGGRETNATWLVYATVPSSSFRILVTYLLSPQLDRGVVPVQLSEFVGYAVSHYWQPTLPAYYIMGIELGSEFEALGGSGILSWNVYSMEIGEAANSTEIVR